MRQKLHWGDLSRPRDGAVIAELRVRDLATIADVTLTARPRPQRPHRRDRRREVDAGRRARPAARRARRQRQRAAGRGEGHRRGRLRGDRQGHARPRSRRSASTSRTAASSCGARSRPRGAPAPGSTAALRPPSVLAQLGALLVDLHGQHETQSLLRADAQRDILDAFAHAEGRARGRGRGARVADGAPGRGDRRWLSRRDEVRRRADYLRHVVAEIDAARAEGRRGRELEIEARRLSQAGALAEQAQRVADALDRARGTRWARCPSPTVR